MVHPGVTAGSRVVILLGCGSTFQDWQILLLLPSLMRVLHRVLNSSWVVCAPTPTTGGGTSTDRTHPAVSTSSTSSARAIGARRRIFGQVRFVASESPRRPLPALLRAAGGTQDQGVSRVPLSRSS